MSSFGNQPDFFANSTDFANNQHFVSASESVRYDWPFWNFKRGDYLLIGDEDPDLALTARRRAMNATGHYRRTRGFRFASQRVTPEGAPGMVIYKVWRVE